LRFLLGFIALIFLGSCASVNNSIMKRRYNKGFHVDLASGKRSNPKGSIEQKEKTSLPEEVDVVAVEKQKIETSQEHISTGETTRDPLVRSINSQMDLGSKSSPQSDLYCAAKQTLVKNVTAFKIHKNNYSDFKFGLGVILFVILTLVYALAIVLHNPGFPFGLALIVGMIGALLTMLTGRVFM
jgi:hypothetical protein